jgi:hypothetical protein
LECEGKRILYAPAPKKNRAADICVIAATSQRTKEVIASRSVAPGPLARVSEACYQADAP